MCIALISTAHPSYPLIIIDNRDEYLRRPTSTADWWPSHSSHVLSSRDLARTAQGTWMGVTSEGKVAVLTNYREKATEQAIGACSRGAVVNSWLTPPPGSRQDTRSFIRDLVTSGTLDAVGGFSLLCGYIDEPLAVVSNRSVDMEHIPWVATERGQTRGLSNTSFQDRSWTKILEGERLMREAIDAHVHSGGSEDEDTLIHRLLDVLSTDTLPEVPENIPASELIHFLKESIFIPMIGANEGLTEKAIRGTTSPCVQDSDALHQAYMSGAYGTQKQTVLLVDSANRVRYFERTLYDSDANPISIGKGDRSFEYVVGR